MLNEIFSFLHVFKNINENVKNGELMQSCIQFENLLRHNERPDIHGKDLFDELQIVAKFPKERKIDHVLDILNELRSIDMEKLVPNAAIAYRILLTIPVSVASAERSFSKLKIIKNYLRNSMSFKIITSSNSLS